MSYARHLSDAAFHAGQARAALERAQDLAPTELHHDKVGQAITLVGRVQGWAAKVAHRAGRAERRREAA